MLDSENVAQQPLSPAAAEEEFNFEALAQALKTQYNKDHQKKKRKRSKATKKNQASDSVNPHTKSVFPIAEINHSHYDLFTTLLTTSIKDPNIIWKRVVNLFNSPAGFKGTVYGRSNGSAHTFEVFLLFHTDTGKLSGFLSEPEFKTLKEEAEPISYMERSFLKHNKRLVSYRLPDGLRSIGTSFFTLHNPHPYPYLYPALLERLRKQFDLLGLSLDTVFRKKG